MTVTNETDADWSSRKQDYRSRVCVWKTYPTLHRQLLAFVCGFCGCCGCGVTLGFSGVLLPNIRKFVDEKYEPWIVGCNVLTTPVGILLGSLAMRKYGRKPTLIYSNVPWIIGWATLAASYDLKTILLGSCLIGLSNGLNNNSVLVYGIEVTEPKLRGFLTGFTQVFFSVGVLAGNFLGILFHWRIALASYAVFPALSFFFGFFLRESPNWLIVEGRTEEARKNFFWLRGVSAESQREYETLMTKQAENKMKHKRGILKNVFSSQFFYPCFVMVTMFTATISTGVDLFTYYTLDVLESLSTTMNAKNVLMMISAVRLMATVVSPVLIKKLRRKPVYFLSSFCTLLSLVAIIGSIRYKLGDELLIFNVCSFVGAANAGIIPIPWIMIAEVFPQVLRDIGSGLIHVYVYFLEFAVVEIGPLMLKRLGLSVSFCIFTIFSSVCALILYFIMPETEKFTLQEVEDKVQNNIKPNIYIIGVGSS